MIPYKVYNKYPQLMSFLFKLCLLCQCNQDIPIYWRIAHEVYIPKNKTPNPSSIKEFVSHIIKNNKFVNASIQKGCTEKIPGCWEHMSMVWDSLKSAKHDKTSLSAIWLDVANAYGSVSHQIIYFALKRYGVSEKWIKNKDYFSRIFTI